MMKKPMTFLSALAFRPLEARKWRRISAMPIVALLMMPIFTAPVSAQTVDQATLGDLQLRIIAIENTLRDVNARVENDLFELKQTMASGGNTNAVLERVDQKLNDLSNISNEISSLNLKIQNILQIASDNEFRILQLEARMKTLMRLSTNGAIISPEQSEQEGDNPTAGSTTKTQLSTLPTQTLDANGNGVGESLDANTAALNTANNSVEGSENTGWVINKSDLDAGTTAVANPAQTNLTVTEPEPRTPAILPVGTEEEQYNFAKDLLHNNRLKEAELALIEFSELHEDSELSADVMFWIGRVQFVQGEHQKSLQTMSDFLKSWPEDPRKIEVLMWIAESVSKTRPKEDACNFFEKLILTVENPPEKLTNRLARLGEKTECEA
jgi:TolA-binding protein